LRPGCISSVIVIGTNTDGWSPIVVPSKPSGPTPMMVIGTPLMTIFSPRTPGSLAKRVRQ
jgi:hypothetical protein